MTGALYHLRLYLRRDRFITPAWVLVFGLAPALYVASVEGLYTSPAALEQFAATTAASRAEVALYGPIWGASLGSLGVWKAGIYFMLIGVAVILTIVRHTRAEEESGRSELLESTAVGRHAGLSAALLLACGASVLTGVLAAAALASRGLPIGGSVAFGAALSWSGLVFAGVAAVCAQLSASARVARGMALAVLGAAFALRAVGDAGSGMLSWLSPLGWSLQVRAFAGERWWVLWLHLAAAAVSIAAAFLLLARRDLGAGLMAERAGPAAAPRRLSGAYGLAWRMQRGALAAWTVGLGLYGLLIGSAVSSVGGQLGDSQALRDVVARMGGSDNLEDAFLAAGFTMLGIGASAYAIAATLRLSEEEGSGRGEAILVRSVSRLRWVASQLAFALLGPALAMVVAGLAAALTFGSPTRVLGAASIQLPAIWLLAGTTVALFGLAPRLARASWAVLSAFLLVYFVGSIAQFPPWLLDVVPFSALPKLPGEEFRAAPVLWLLGVAAALTGVGFIAFRRRDLR